MPASRRGGVRVERIYDDPAGDTYRVLVDRLWPRGITKERAALDQWAKDVAPSADLRRWYGHEPAKFEEFARRYRVELSQPPAASTLGELRTLAHERVVTLLTATGDVERSAARVLLDLLQSASRARRS
jgi:uncharacterized protein YeaO (DUF488 family)